MNALSSTLTSAPAAVEIDRRIEELGGWRGPTLAKVRALIKKAVPEVIEEWKWQTPVWSHHGIICTGEAYKAVVKMTFAHGAALEDPRRLFNSSLGGNTRRAIDVGEGEVLDDAGLIALFKAAAAYNTVKSAGRGTSPTKTKPAKKAAKKTAKKAAKKVTQRPARATAKRATASPRAAGKAGAKGASPSKKATPGRKSGPKATPKAPR